MSYQFQSETSQRIFNTAMAPYRRPGTPGILHDGVPEFIAACLVGQSKFETNNYTNKFAQVELCFFSYSYTTHSIWQIPGGGRIADNHAPVAKYSSLEDSVHEMQDWIKRRQVEGRFPADLNTITNSHEYARLLQACGFYQGWPAHTPEENLEDYAKGIQTGIDNLK